jgi:hypothetical protein
MNAERIRFGVDVDRKLDSAIKDLAEIEHRSKRNMHQVLLRRIVDLWKSDPEKLKQIQLIRP